jgi:uncharacterized membrane protein YccF (DUF307 family)
MAQPILVAGGPASLEVAGGGDFPQQTTQEIHVEVVTPQNNTLAITTGVVVPVVLAIFGWWMMHRKKAPAVAVAAPDPYAKTDADK